VIPLFNYNGPTKVLGFDMNQNRLAIPTWSYLMETYPPKRIIELGAYNGGFTTAIGVHAWRIGAEVHSWDTSKCPNDHWKSLSDFLNIRFYQDDVFSNVDTIGSLIASPGPTILLCDNGDKKKEFNTFSQFLKPGDIIGAHDYHVPDYWYCSEITLKDVEYAVKANELTPFMQEHFDLCGWLVFRK
jgi:hypothetical protein